MENLDKMLTQKKPDMLDQIVQRSEGVSDKVKETLNRYTNQIKQMGAEPYLSALKMDFDWFIDNYDQIDFEHEDNPAANYFIGWSLEELKELYYVLFNEKK